MTIYPYTALLLLHLQVPQRLRKVKMIEKIDNICVQAILLAKKCCISREYFLNL